MFIYSRNFGRKALPDAKALWPTTLTPCRPPNLAEGRKCARLRRVRLCGASQLIDGRRLRRPAAPVASVYLWQYCSRRRRPSQRPWLPPQRTAAPAAERPLGAAAASVYCRRHH